MTARLCSAAASFTGGICRLPTPPGGTVLLRNYQDDVVVLGEGVQAGHGKGRGTAEDDTHCVTLRACLRSFEMKFA